MSAADVIGHRSMPVLGVRDVGASAAFYRERLGFALGGLWGPDEGPPSFAILDLGTITLALHRDEAARPRVAAAAWAAYLYIDGLEAYHRALEANGVTILEAPHETFYGCLEMTIEDLDGHQLAFGQDLHPGARGPGLSDAAAPAEPSA